MSRKPWHLSRRTMLKGLGVTLGLPLFEAMMPSVLWGDEPRVKVVPRKMPVRMAALYMANGVNPSAWTPKVVGPLTELSPILQPLDKIRADVLVLSQLWNKASNSGDGHYFKESAWLTGTTIAKTTGADINVGGVSLDQFAAQHIGSATKLPSIELATEPTRTAVDNNVQITQLYGGHISWNTPTTPMAKEIDPKLAFDRLFRDRVPTAGQAVKRPTGLGPADEASILDTVLQEGSSLKARLGAADQRKLDEYLTSVRDIERRIEQDAKRDSAPRKIDPGAYKALPALDEAVKKGRNENGNPAAHAERVKLMIDIMILAFWTDTTRIATFMFGNSVSGKNFTFVPGVTGGHHDMSHHENRPEKLEQYKLINTWHVAQFAYMCEKMKSIKEGEGTMLDNSMVLFGSALRDGNSHNPHDLPILLGGRGGNTLQTGRHIAFKQDTPLCNLYGEMLARLGVQVDRFGDSTGPLPQLTEKT